MSTDIEHRGRGARKAKKQKLAAAAIASQSRKPIPGGSKDIVPAPTSSTSAESSEDAEEYEDPVEYLFLQKRMSH